MPPRRTSREKKKQENKVSRKAIAEELEISISEIEKLTFCTKKIEQSAQYCRNINEISFNVVFFSYNNHIKNRIYINMLR